MSLTLEQFGIDRLSPHERLELIGLIWDSLPPDTPLTPPDWHLQELERRVAADSFLVQQCERAAADAMQAGTDVESDSIASLAKELRHVLAVYRRVLRCGLRSTSALLRVTSALGHEIGPGI